MTDLIERRVLGAPDVGAIAAALTSRSSGAQHAHIRLCGWSVEWMRECRGSRAGGVWSVSRRPRSVYGMTNILTASRAREADKE